MTHRRLMGAVAALLLATVGAALFPGAVGIALTAGAILVLVVAVAGAFGRARGLRTPHPSPFEGLVPPDAPVERPGDLARLERMLGWKEYSVEDFDHRVAPVLARILTSRLAARGVDVAADPDRARRLTSPVLHRLLDPSAGRDATVDTAEIAALVDALEAL